MEKNQMKKYGRAGLLRLFLKGSGGFFALCIGTGLLLTVCDTLVPQILRYAVDTVIGGGQGTEKILRTAMLAVAAGAVGALCRYATNRYRASAGETLVKNIRDTLYSHIQRLPWDWHASHATGDIIQRCTSDVETIKRFLEEQFVAVFRIVTLLAISLGCMVSMNFKLALVPLCFAPVIILYSTIFHRHVHERFLACDEAEGLLSSIAQENLTGVRVVRAFGRERYEKDRFEAQNQVYTNRWVKLCYTLGLFWATGDLCGGLQAMLVLVLGVGMCVKGSLSTGELIAFLTYNTMMAWPIRALGRMISEMSKAGVSIDRLGEIMNAPEEQDAPDCEDADMGGDIVFDHVSFAYDEHTEALRDVSFTIPAGCTLGILGATGSGKSTLLHLLCRLMEPVAGRITCGGRDIAHMRRQDVRRQVGIVLQEPFLFSRSIGENITFTGADAEEMRVAAVTACVDDDITGFPAGYDTQVGERGVTLSGGQKQRVAMARALTQDTPVLIFDDSLSAVDTETDSRIREALKQRRQGVTAIFVSHRVTTLADCDLVLVLEKGRVAELGTPAELERGGGIYQRICALQSAGMEE